MDVADCPEHGDIMRPFYNIFMATTGGICSVLCCILIVYFIRTWKSDGSGNRASKILYRTGLGFLCNELLFFVTSTMNQATVCRPALEGVYAAADVVNTLFYVGDYLLIMVMFYLRLFYVFENSAHAITARQNRFFWVWFVSMIVSAAIAIVVIALDILPVVYYIGIAFFALSIFLILCVLMISFTVKLYKVYKLTGAAGPDNLRDGALRDIITKTSMLAVISLSFSVLSYVFVGVSLGGGGSLGFAMFTTVTTYLDKITNVVCVMLPYDVFKKIYGKWCRVCDAGWGGCWTAIVGERSPAATMAADLTIGAAAHVGANSMQVASTTDVTATADPGSKDSTN